VSVGASVAVLVLAPAGETTLEVGVRLAAISLVVLVAALVLEWASLVPAALLGLGATYATVLAVDDVSLDAKAPLVAAALVVAAELAYWSLEETDAPWRPPGEAMRRLLLVAAIAIATLGVGGAVLALSDLGTDDNLAIDLVGAAAAAGVLIVVVLASRREER
jgi:hypothetical protein